MDLDETYDYHTLSEALENYLTAREAAFRYPEKASFAMKSAAEQMDRLTQGAWTELNRSE